MIPSCDNDIWGKWCDGTSITVSGYSTISNYSFSFNDCSGCFDYSAGNRLYGGQWISDYEYAARQLKALLENCKRWRHVVLKPFLKIGRSKPRINIFQPVWSHLRRKSITSKTRQFRRITV